VVNGGSDLELWVFIFPIKWGAKELPRVSQPHTSYFKRNGQSPMNAGLPGKTIYKHAIIHSRLWVYWRLPQIIPPFWQVWQFYRWKIQTLKPWVMNMAHFQAVSWKVWDAQTHTMRVVLNLLLTEEY